MYWAKMLVVISSILLVFSAGASMSTSGAKLQPVSLTFEMSGCRNDRTCAADFIVGDKVTFSGSLTTEDGRPVKGAKISIVRFLPTPEMVTVASGVTGIDGTYSITWEARLSAKPVSVMDPVKQLLAEQAVFLAEFGGDDTHASARTGKLTAVISPNKITTLVNAEKRVYAGGESAIIFIAFIDSKDRFIDPDSIRATFDGEETKAEKKKTGSYTLTTPPLTVEHHQVIVIPKKEGYNLSTGYLTVQVSAFV